MCDAASAGVFQEWLVVTQIFLAAPVFANSHVCRLLDSDAVCFSCDVTDATNWLHTSWCCFWYWQILLCIRRTQSCRRPLYQCTWYNWLAFYTIPSLPLPSHLARSCSIWLTGLVKQDVSLFELHGLFGASNYDIAVYRTPKRLTKYKEIPLRDWLGK